MDSYNEFKRHKTELIAKDIGFKLMSSQRSTSDSSIEAKG